MNCLSQISSRLEAFFRSSSSQFRAQTSLYGSYACSWTRTISYSPPRIAVPNQNSALTRFGVRLYSAKVGKSGGSVSRSRRKSEPEPAMEKEKQPKEAFYVVRKGDVVGVYKSLNDCQAQVGSSICDPPVSVFKGNCLPKETEEYLTSRGLKDAVYSIRAEDINESLFGPLVQCALQVKHEGIGSISVTTDSSQKHAKFDHFDMGQLSSASSMAGHLNCALKRSCILKFDGASKGNPGKAGAGAVLLADDGSLVQGLWKVKNENIAKLYKEVKKLKDKFRSFEINHVLRNLNSEADKQANLAVSLADGEILVES
ncbi:hypothetical protein TIFTF001_042359 [Ficus carica]|uniref:RNase H type-1 domain-containing protein n=1 Tax=Ficus carica TaxID=3494 RepID=A0AA87ZGX6_FICCA|nr:hypothetical protein TIFTF001_042358 [Ficus carica]GMN36078.1 hypothetical protein TIFTF001_042359 [Ficus carica]